jgi:hypothetical protein
MQPGRSSDEFHPRLRQKPPVGRRLATPRPASRTQGDGDGQRAGDDNAECVEKRHSRVRDRVVGAVGAQIKSIATKT